VGLVLYSTAKVFEHEVGSLFRVTSVTGTFFLVIASAR
jgi:hypothetical protein